MTVTTNEYGQQNMFAKEPQMVVESYNRKGLESPQQYAETYNGRWAMMGIISGFISYAATGKFSSASSDDRNCIHGNFNCLPSSARILCTTTR